MGNIIIDTASNIMYKQQDKDIKDLNSLLMYYNDTIDKNVTGWFYPLDIILTYILMREAQNSFGSVCELGVAFGKSAIGLSLIKKKDEHLYLYDNFAAEITPTQAMQAIEKHGLADNLHMNVLDLMKYTPKQEDFVGEIRYLHIDACHLHKAVLNDLENFSQFMTYDGIISVDDFNDQEYPGINTAITQFCLSHSGKDWTLFAIGQNKAYLCRKDFVKNYSVFLVNYFNQYIKQVGLNLTEFINNSVVFVGSRSPMNGDRILDILEGKLEIVYS